LQGLEFDDRLAELAPRARIGEAGFEAGLGNADGERRNADAPLSRRPSYLEAAPLGAEPRVLGELDLVEMQGADRRGALAHLVLLGRATRLCGKVDDEKSHAALAGGRIGARQDEAMSATGALWIHNFEPDSRSRARCAAPWS